MIKDYKNKTSGPIKGTFLISKVDYKPFANKPGSFLACEFTDLSGSIKAVMWEGFSSYKSWLKNKIVVDITGELSTFKDATQVQIKNINPATVYDATLLVPSLPTKKITEIETGLNSVKATIQNDLCKEIWGEILGDHLGSLKPAYLHCPGGVGDVHHNYCGGLAEHSFSMIRIGELMALTHGLDRDIVLTGCLVHDIGKIQCYHWDLVIEMSDLGRLLHHTTIGYRMLLDIIQKKALPLDNPTFSKLAHIIIAHHEEEGIRKTMFAEAHAVSHIDALDAIVTHAIAYSTAPENKDENSNWTRFCSLTQRQYYIPVIQKFILDPSPDIAPETLTHMLEEKAKKKSETFAPKKEFDIDDLFGDAK